MYATINLPGSSHFEYYGPDTKSKCENWLKERVAILSRTEQITSLLPQRVVSDKEALSWKYRDGSRVIRPSMSTVDLELAFGKSSRACGCPADRHYQSCPGYSYEL